ncbi:hypothetical protein LCGC14_1099170 [marine sediment metagenome]|uniref:Uncharacterized protein n=1 Tax=marine sediment metagenome TaxID=412755 RepID=A0A0F9MEJ5_9ZZZZ
MNDKEQRAYDQGFADCEAKHAPMIHSAAILTAAERLRVAAKAGHEELLRLMNTLGGLPVSSGVVADLHSALGDTGTAAPRKDLETQIADLETERGRINRELTPLYQARAEVQSPFEIGDVVTDNRGWRARVVKIAPGVWSSEYPLITGVRLLRKDGTDGQELALYKNDEWQKERE